MKKFFEKHDLFKLVSIFIILAIIFSWLFKQSSLSGMETELGEITRVGMFDIIPVLIVGFYYYTAASTVILFLLVVAGFYKVLNTIPAYKKMTSSIASLFIGKGKVLAVLSVIFYGCLTGILKDYFVLLAIVPLSIAIMRKLKYDKISALASTFGGMLVGILGSTYSGKAAALLADSKVGLSGITVGYEMLAVIVLFAMSSILLLYFIFSRLNKDGLEVVEDMFDDENVQDFEVAKKVKQNKKAKKIKVEKKSAAKKAPVKKASTKKASTKKTTSKKKTAKKSAKKTKASLAKNVEVIKVKAPKVNFAPIAIVLAFMFVILVVAFIDWTASFNIKLFTDVHTWINEATIFGAPVFSYILGSLVSVPYGEWDLFAACTVILFNTVLLMIIYRIKLNTVIEKFGEGFKLIAKTALIVSLVYFVLIIGIYFPTIPAIVASIVGSGSNVARLFGGAAFASIFTVDFQWTLNIVGTYFGSVKNLHNAALALQTAYGFVSFISPTSIVLMAGLSMLNIKFSDWLKFIWKFLILLLIIIAAIFLVLYLV